METLLTILFVLILVVLYIGFGLGVFYLIFPSLLTYLGSTLAAVISILSILFAAAISSAAE